MQEKIIGIAINFGDGEGNRYDGTVVGVWLDGGTTYQSLKVMVECTDGRYREAWLTNCVSGLLPREKEKR